MRSAQTIRDYLHFARAFEPDSPKIPELEAELVEARKVEKKRRDARKAVKDGISTATHVRLKDGWVEVVKVEGGHTVLVANGENRRERVPVTRVLEVRSL